MGKNVDAAQHLVARINRKSDFLGSHVMSLLGLLSSSRRERRRPRAAKDDERYAAFFLATGSSMIPMMSDSFMMRSICDLGRSPRGPLVDRLAAS